MGKDKILDYHDFCDINTPHELRKRFNIGDYYTNEVKCNVCGDVIRSRNGHDMVYCTCRNVSVDGGSWYLKRGFKTRDFEERSILFTDVKELEDD